VRHQTDVSIIMNKTPNERTKLLRRMNFWWQTSADRCHYSRKARQRAWKVIDFTDWRTFWT